MTAITSGSLTVTRHPRHVTIEFDGGGAGGVAMLERTVRFPDGRTETVPVAGGVGISTGSADYWVDADVPFKRVASITYTLGWDSVTIDSLEHEGTIISDPATGVAVEVIGASISQISRESAASVSWLSVRHNGFPLVSARPEQSPVVTLSVLTRTRKDREKLASLLASRKPILFRTSEPDVDDMWFTIIGQRVESRLADQQAKLEWRRHEWEAHVVERPNPSLARHAGNTLGQLAAIAFNDSTEGRWRLSAGAKRITSGSRYDAFPCVTKRPDGTLVITWVSQSDHFNRYSAPVGMMAVSSDGGKTWPRIPNAIPSGYTATAIRAFGDRLALLLSQKDKLFISTSTSPSGPWSEPREITKKELGTTSWVFSSDLIWFPTDGQDGRMIATAYTGVGIVAAASDDAGKTWKPLPQPVKAKFEKSVGPAEPCLTRLADGRLLMMVRWDTKVDGGKMAAGDFWAVWSSDQGNTWSQPVKAIAGVTGQPAISQAPDGTLVVTIRRLPGASARMGTWALGFSRDLGASWEIQDIDSSEMTYGQIAWISDTEALLIGASDHGEITCVVWCAPLTLSQRRISTLGGIAQRWMTLGDISMADLAGEVG